MNQQPSTFTWPLARKLASYCAQAYDRDDITDVATDAAAIVTLDGNDDIIVAFRGSRAARDFVQDAKVRFTTLVFDNKSVVETESEYVCKSCGILPEYDHCISDEKAPEDWRTPKAGAKPVGSIKRDSVLDCGSPLPLFVRTARQLDLQKSRSGIRQRVHEGFLQDFEAIDLAVTSNVRTYLAIHPQAKIYIAGHSLGGALAILCAYQFVKQQLPVAGVYTFGQPRVGNVDFATMYEAAELRTSDSALRTLHDLTFRVVNQNDLVPRIPGWLMGYRHCGQEIFLRPDGRAEVSPTLVEKLLWDAAGLYRAYRHGEEALIREHHLGAYQVRIQNL